MIKKAPANLKILDELKAITRRLTAIESRIDLMDSDMQILETIQGRISGLEETVALTRKHDKQAVNDIKTDISMSEMKTGAIVESKVEEIKDIIAKKKIVHIKPNSFWTKLMSKRW